MRWMPATSITDNEFRIIVFQSAAPLLPSDEGMGPGYIPEPIPFAVSYSEKYEIAGRSLLTYTVVNQPPRQREEPCARSQ